jgi:hypothetical protein
VTIAIRASGEISVTPYRAAYRRYWQAPLIDDPVPDSTEFRGTRNEGRGAMDEKVGDGESR